MYIYVYVTYIQIEIHETLAHKSSIDTADNIEEGQDHGRAALRCFCNIYIAHITFTYVHIYFMQTVFIVAILFVFMFF